MSGSTNASQKLLNNMIEYCPYRQASLLQQALSPDKMRVGFFVGAGCPVSIKVNDQALIPAVDDLTNNVFESIQKTKYKDKFSNILNRLVGSGIDSPNIEEILTHVRALYEVVGAGKIDNISKVDLEKLDKEICDNITILVKKPLPHNDTPYHQLATWIRGIRRAHPVEIFTSNYDLLIEQALEECQVPYFDGFVGSRNTFFDLASIEQDSLPVRWARLWKVHGSVNWWKTERGDVERRDSGNQAERQMIYPSHMKYDQSRRMPYFAMLDRLRSFLGRGQAVLVSCGYSFSDQHLNEVILQGLSSNPTAICFALLFGEKEKYKEAMRCAQKNPNLSLLAQNGAVSGMVNGSWKDAQKIDHPMHELAVRVRKISGDVPEICELMLGDFKVFGDFLARQVAPLSVAEDVNA